LVLDTGTREKNKTRNITKAAQLIGFAYSIILSIESNDFSSETSSWKGHPQLVLYKTNTRENNDDDILKTCLSKTWGNPEEKRHH
jgi:hypothetical protein